ncbi:MAG: formylglycine-generating enzyme family protein [Kofleriaceae bacterium]|nr:MAG: formylglycine-generating enzyme family protein [Kofleriaceae bacterium]MBZ0232889.1 formylglycine-generating enzyme family protein [Kofleriaceae bacterium]
MRRWWIVAVGLIIAIGAVALGVRYRAREVWRPSVVVVPAGTFRASILCDVGFDRGCWLSDRPPEGKGRWRVTVWLDAFWADAGQVTREQYESCRKSGACRGMQDPPNELARCNASSLAWVTFDDARAYCASRGWRLPTPDEFERMARWTDGRRFAWGDRGSPSPCDRRPTPEGIRDLNLFGEWVAAPTGEGGNQGYPRSYDFRPFTDGTSPFRCVRSLRSGPNAGKAVVWPQQDDPWLLGGPDL